MVLGNDSAKTSSYRTVLLLMMLTLLTGCAFNADVKQLIAPPNSALLIKQNKNKNSLTLPVAGEKFTHLESVRVNPKQTLATPSNSVAIEKSAGNIYSPAISTSVSSPEMGVEQAKKTLIRYLSMVEDQPESIEKILVQAEQLVQRYPDDSFLQSLWQRLSRYSEWQPVNSINSSAGIDLVSFKGWQPDSAFIRIRRALLPTVADNEQVIFGDLRLVLIMVNLKTAALNVEVRLDDIPFLPKLPVVLNYQVDDNLPKQITLTDQDDWRHLRLSIPSGQHAVRFYQQQSVGNQFIKLRFHESSGELTVAQERPYFISTPAQPLEFYAQGPTLLRIDELEEGNTAYRYQKVAEGWHTIRLLPPKGKSRSLMRVSQRVVNLQPTPLNNRIIKRTLKPVEEAKIESTSPIVSDKVKLIDAFKLGKQEDGTLSVGLDFVRRNNIQESGNLPEEQFKQYKLNYRYFDEPKAAYWNSQGLLRMREHGGPTLGLEESVYYNPDWLPFNVRASAKLFVQIPHDPNNQLGLANLLIPGAYLPRIASQISNQQMEALGQVNIALSQAYNLTPKLSLIPSLTFFARAMSMRTANQNYAPNEVDQDIFTPYKANHSMGLSPALTIEYKPWLDTLISSRFSVQSNEDLFFYNKNNTEKYLILYPVYGLFHADHFNFEQHWQQLLGSVALDAFVRMTFFQPDADRKQASQRLLTGLELNWQHWTSHQNRIEVSAKYAYTAQIIADNITSDSHLATLSFTYHFGEGRGLRDFAPGEIDFRDIRQRQFVDGHNNSLRDIYD